MVGMKSQLGCHILWAKSNDASGYSLPLHLLDVAAVALTLTKRLPVGAQVRIAKDFNCLQTEAASIVALCAGMHDLGKAIPGFQAKWEPGRKLAEEAGFVFDTSQLVLGDRHDAFSVRITDTEFRRKGVAPPLRREIVKAIGAHHGFAIADAPTRKHLQELDEKWQACHTELLELLYKTTNANFTGAQEKSAFACLREWLSGLISVADWIGSDTRFFPHDRAWVSYEAHWQESQRFAEQALDAIGFVAGPALQTAHLPRKDWMREILRGRDPRSLQTALMSTVTDTDAPLLLVIEAPMGEGKTEAALWTALTQSLTGDRGVYFALPTQATANGLFPRVKAFMEKFAAEGIADAQLVHSGLKPNNIEITPKDIDLGKQDGVSAAWFAPRKRGLIAPIGVGTIDQALIGVLEAKHRFVRLFSLADRTVVLDEVHAYDAYTSGLIERLVEWLGALGSSVVLMSATLPTSLRDRLIRAWAGREVQIPKLDYPRLLCIQANKPITGQSFAPSQSREVAIVNVEDSEVGAIALAAAQNGAAVLIVCNTVARAQSRYRELASERVRVRLFHARYPAEDRLRRETDIIESFGPEGSNNARPGIVIATQVIEQSLDVDFDVLISDLAPIDLLFQRMGRLHRHKNRPRPVCALTATTYVTGLTLELENVIKLIAPIYESGPLARTQDLLSARRQVLLPRDIDALVQLVYADKFAWSTEAREKGEAADNATADRLKIQASLAEGAVLPPPSEPGAISLLRLLDDNDSEYLGTRLGEGSVLIIPIYVINQRFSATRDCQESWSSSENIPLPCARLLALQTVSISNKWVISRIKEQARKPRGWDKHAALTNALPWYITPNGESVTLRGCLRLDPELGVVFG
jgi:CRISPR-associated endonuclease/helicase Cas3